jgi:hypothetical protein
MLSQPGLGGGREDGRDVAVGVVEGQPDLHLDDRAVLVLDDLRFLDERAFRSDRLLCKNGGRARLRTFPMVCLPSIRPPGNPKVSSR